MKVVLIPGMGCTPVTRCNWYKWFATTVNEKYQHIDVKDNNASSQKISLTCKLQDFPDPYQCRESIWLPFVESLVMNDDGGDFGHVQNENNDRRINERRDRNIENTIVIGHSSGAACAMRLMEKIGQENLYYTTAVRGKDVDDDDDEKDDDVNENDTSAAANDSSPSTTTSSAPARSKLAGVILVAAAYTDLNDEDERRSEYFNRDWDWQAMKHGSHKTILFHGTDDNLIPVGEARYIASKLGSGPTKCDDNDDDRDGGSEDNKANFRYIELDGKSHFFEPWQEILDVLEDIYRSKSCGGGGGGRALVLPRG